MSHGSTVFALALAPLLASCTENRSSAQEAPPAPIDSEARPATVAPSASAAADAAPAATMADAAPHGPMVTTTHMGSIIYERPSFTSFQLGTFRAGAMIPRAEEPVANGEGCGGKWYAVQPAGYVCVGRDGVTTDVDDPLVKIVQRYAPKDEPLPYGYGMSNGAHLYARVPTPAEQKQVEQDLDAHMKQWQEQREKTPADKLPPLTALPIQPMPDFLADHAQAPVVLPWVPPGKVLRVGYAPYQTRLAFVAAFDVEGRPFYLTTESYLVPADRMKANKLSDFQGIELAPPDADGPHLPFAWVRWGTASLYKLESGEMDGGGEKLVPTDFKMVFQNHAELRPEPVRVGGVPYFEIVHPDALIGRAPEPGERYVVKTTDVTRVDGAKELPERVEKDEVWVEVNVGKQSLVLYRGLTPLFTTLVATGAGKGHETPLGRFKIYSKQTTARMDAEEKPAEEDGGTAEHAYRYDDVPWVQYLHEGIAFHAAFWHDGFGVPHSHGCINLSPRDAHWLFEHTLPAMPPGWHAVNTGRAGIPWGTTVKIGY